MPTPPRLANVSDVELMHTGTWDLSTGTARFTRGDLLAAVAAMQCPAIRAPVLKLGHLDPSVPAADGDGKPTIGWVGNLRTGRDGHVLLGDYLGLPAWMTAADDAGRSVIASAYADRSVEGAWNWRCQLGHTHPFVITAVALLGQSAPGIGTLTSLHDLRTLYQGVAAAGPGGDPVTVTIHTKETTTVPSPKPTMVSAGVSLDDLRDEWREHADYDQWITEVVLNPLQLIVQDDGSGALLRIPVTIGAGDTVTFGPPVPVRVQYVDDPEDNQTAAAARIVYASRAESRPDQRHPVHAAPPAGPAPSPAPATPPDSITDLRGAPPVPDDLSAIRARLGLPDDADTAAILAALDTSLGAPAGTTSTPPAPPPAPDPVAPAAVDPATAQPEPATTAAATGPPQLPPGVVTIDATRLAALERDAQAGAAAAARQRSEDRDRYIAAAVAAGKFAPARTSHWRTAWDADPDGTRATIDALAAGLVPVGQPAGYAAGEDTTDRDGDADDARLFSPDVFARMSSTNSREG